MGASEGSATPAPAEAGGGIQEADSVRAQAVRRSREADPKRSSLMSRVRIL
jgi:hypothetical protein